jgi:hypothetical protein
MALPTAVEKFSDFDNAALNSLSYIVGYEHSGNNKRYSMNDLTSFMSKLVTSPSDSTTLTDSFLLYNISMIVTNNQSYLKDVDFTQNTSTGTITGVTISFTTDQKILLRR